MKSISTTLFIQLVLVCSSVVSSAPRGGGHRHGHNRQGGPGGRLAQLTGGDSDSGGFGGGDGSWLSKRDNTCQFPYHENMVAVTPGEANGGWAMSPDQKCSPGTNCPYACAPGMLSAQWNKSATSYTYPQSQYGGLYCDENGQLQTPFEDKPYCVQGTGKVTLDNQAGKNVAMCQTVLPGNEAMLIPTNVEAGSSQVLAVPDPSYWAGTAAHYYVNPPGVSTEDGCVWGSTAHPWGNWSPYVAGANTDNNGNTFVKIGWNPVYLEAATPFRDQKPDFGVRITCKSGNCNGLPCSIDPSKNDINEVESGDSASGAGGGNFCVVTAENSGEAIIEVFDVGGNSGNGTSSDSSDNNNAAGVNRQKAVPNLLQEVAVSSVLAASSSSSASDSSSSSSTVASPSTSSSATQDASSTTQDASSTTQDAETTTPLPSSKSSSSTISSSSSAEVSSEVAASFESPVPTPSPTPTTFSVESVETVVTDRTALFNYADTARVNSTSLFTTSASISNSTGTAAATATADSRNISSAKSSQASSVVSINGAGFVAINCGTLALAFVAVGSLL